MTAEIRIGEEYIFIIDTDHFADFAGQLAAYCTGVVSEDESESIASFADEVTDNSLAEITVEKELPEGWRNYSIWPSKIWAANDSGEYARLTQDNFQQFDEPAGFSVGIYFDSELDSGMIALLKERATQFFEKYKSDVKIEGFRLISHIKTAREIQI